MPQRRALKRRTGHPGDQQAPPAPQRFRLLALMPARFLNTPATRRAPRRPGPVASQARARLVCGGTKRCELSISAGYAVRSRAESLRPITGHSGSERRRRRQPVVTRAGRGALRPPAAGFRISRGMPRIVGALGLSPRDVGMSPYYCPRRSSRRPFLSLVSPPALHHHARDNKDCNESARRVPPPAPRRRRPRRRDGRRTQRPELAQRQQQRALGVRRRSPRPPGKHPWRPQLTKGALLPDEPGDQARRVGADAARPAAGDPPERDRQAQDRARGLGRHRRHCLRVSSQS